MITIYKGAELLAIALRSNKSLAVLDLADNNLGTKGIEILKESIISNKTLHELKVNNNNLGSGNGSKVIAEILKQQESLKKLDISNNNIKDLSIIEHIAKTLGITKIKAVIMKINGITDTGAQAIVDNVKQEIRIDITCNDIENQVLLDQIQELGLAILIQELVAELAGQIHDQAD